MGCAPSQNEIIQQLAKGTFKPRKKTRAPPSVDRTPADSHPYSISKSSDSESNLSEDVQEDFRGPRNKVSQEARGRCQNLPTSVVPTELHAVYDEEPDEVKLANGTKVAIPKVISSQVCAPQDTHVQKDHMDRSRSSDSHTVRQAKKSKKKGHHAARQAKNTKSRSRSQSRGEDEEKVNFPTSLVEAHHAAYAYLNPSLSKYDAILCLTDQTTQTQLMLQQMVSFLTLRFEEINQMLEEIAADGEKLVRDVGPHLRWPDEKGGPKEQPDLLQQLLLYTVNKMHTTNRTVTALTATVLQETCDYLKSAANIFQKRLAMKQEVDERIQTLIEQLEACTLPRSDTKPRDMALYSEDSGIGADTDFTKESCTLKEHSNLEKGIKKASCDGIECSMPRSSVANRARMPLGFSNSHYCALNHKCRDAPCSSLEEKASCSQPCVTASGKLNRSLESLTSVECEALAQSESLDFCSLGEDEEEGSESDSTTAGCSRRPQSSPAETRAGRPVLKMIEKPENEEMTMKIRDAISHRIQFVPTPSASQVWSDDECRPQPARPRSAGGARQRGQRKHRSRSAESLRSKAEDPTLLELQRAQKELSRRLDKMQREGVNAVRRRTEGTQVNAQSCSPAGAEPRGARSPTEPRGARSPTEPRGARSPTEPRGARSLTGAVPRGARSPTEPRGARSLTGAVPRGARSPTEPRGARSLTGAVPRGARSPTEPRGARSPAGSEPRVNTKLRASLRPNFTVLPSQEKPPGQAKAGGSVQSLIGSFSRGSAGAPLPRGPQAAPPTSRRPSAPTLPSVPRPTRKKQRTNSAPVSAGAIASSTNLPVVTAAAHCPPPPYTPGEPPGYASAARDAGAVAEHGTCSVGAASDEAGSTTCSVSRAHVAGETQSVPVSKATVAQRQVASLNSVVLLPSKHMGSDVGTGGAKRVQMAAVPMSGTRWLCDGRALKPAHGTESECRSKMAGPLQDWQPYKIINLRYAGDSGRSAESRLDQEQRDTARPPCRRMVVASHLSGRVEEPSSPAHRGEDASENSAAFYPAAHIVPSPPLKRPCQRSEYSTQPSLDSIQSSVNSTQSTANSTQSSVNPTQSTVNTTQSTANSTQSTANSTQSTVNPSQSSVNSTQSSVNSTQSSVNSTQSTVNSTQSTVNSTQSTVNPSQSSVNTTQPSVNTTQPSVNTTQPSIDTTQLSVNSTQLYVNSIHPSINSTQSSVNLIHSLNSTQPPINTTQSSFNSTQPYLNSSIGSTPLTSNSTHYSTHASVNSTHPSMNSIQGSDLPTYQCVNSTQQPDSWTFCSPVIVKKMAPTKLVPQSHSPDRKLASPPSQPRPPSQFTRFTTPSPPPREKKFASPPLQPKPLFRPIDYIAPSSNAVRRCPDPVWEARPFPQALTNRNPSPPKVNKQQTPPPSPTRSSSLMARKLPSPPTHRMLPSPPAQQKQPSPFLHRKLPTPPTSSRQSSSALCASSSSLPISPSVLLKGSTDQFGDNVESHKSAKIGSNASSIFCPLSNSIFEAKPPSVNCFGAVDASGQSPSIILGDGSPMMSRAAWRNRFMLRTSGDRQRRLTLSGVHPQPFVKRTYPLDCKTATQGRLSVSTSAGSEPTLHSIGLDGNSENEGDRWIGYYVSDLRSPSRSVSHPELCVVGQKLH